MIKTDNENTIDVHSHSKPLEAVITHLDLDIAVNFEQKILAGKARIFFKNITNTDSLFLDIYDLKIEKILNDAGKETYFNISEPKEYLGSALSISIDKNTKYVDVYYQTSPNSEALQWLSKEQTADKKYPFLYTQSEAILARSWIPLQDSPGIRFTYNAKVKCPKELLALMSATNPQQKNDSGIYEFQMETPIPSYLMALTVGDIEFQSLGENCGVYAEPNMLKKCAWELADLEKMVQSAEDLYGKYQWGRYDVIVLPPSFPFGGMENPRLTFATPTIIAGDKSLVSLIAHELAHSWSGNLVTNATWNDFWLNEGFTVYFEQRIMEKLYGKKYTEMLTYLGYQELQNTLADIGNTSDDSHLFLNLKGRNPDDGMSDIAYEKGRFFLLSIEDAVGREKWDEFLKNYFAEFAFQSMTTEKFLKYLDEKLLDKNPEAKAKVRINDWIFSPGLPKDFQPIQSSEFNRVDKTIAAFNEGKKINELDTTHFTTHHWVYFLRGINQNLKSERLAELEKAFHFSKNNSEISFQWFILCIRSNSDDFDIALKNFLTNVGRRKFVKPLFVELIKTEKGKQKAIEIYKESLPTYHAVTRNTIDDLLAEVK